MLKKLKQTTLQSLKSVGVSTMVHNSRWRRERLLILAYHGISVLDEHEWNHTQYMPAEVLRSRLEQLRGTRSNVLPLEEAIERLYRNDLPDRAVAITFDDGTADFYQKAFPLLQEFAMPATLYLTTFYSQYNRPVFDIMCSYLLWKGRQAQLDLQHLTGEVATVDLRSADAQETARVTILRFARNQKLSAEEKDSLLAKLAANINVDYEALLARRIMQNLAPSEVTEISAAGLDVQLHTHRHRTPKDHAMFLREIEDNRKSIQAMTGKVASHFCYPSGVYDPMFLPWLKASGVVSATTCEPGFASQASDRLLLPRVLDNSSLAPIEFESWLTGVSAALPRRR
ncbi:MAG TPA: polysaccharide deacetylase family protein [Pyrinomonadaceae bacterium]|nr:polysaccharide deacetylase family protein [Pyrinomonadaceae bacterium]